MEQLSLPPVLFLYLILSSKLLSIQIKEKEEKGSREGENHILHGSPSADLGRLVQEKNPKVYK